MIISTLTGTISHEGNDRIVDSGASKHMMRYKESFVNMSIHESPHKVKIGDDYQCPIKASGEASYKLESEKSLKIKDVLYVPGFKKNLLSIYALDTKGIGIAFVDRQVLMWPRGKTIEDATVIREEEGGLYKLKGQPEKALVHESNEPSELWNKRLACALQSTTNGKKSSLWIARDPRKA